MGFTYAGNLGGAGAPVVRNFQTGVTMYVGQMVQTGLFTGGAGGHVEIADVATEAFEDDQPIIGFVTGIVDGSRTYVAATSGTAQYGDRTTYTSTQSAVAATGASEVQVTLALPMMTLIRAPLYDTVWGTALTAITETTGDAGGTTITRTSAQADIADNLGTIYCRTGANRGLYRVITDITTVVTTVVVPFPYTIAAGDTFVQASCVLGLGGMDLCTAADAIDGDNDMNYYYPVYYHEINLEESGKEYAIFSFCQGWNSAA